MDLGHFSAYAQADQIRDENHTRFHTPFDTPSHTLCHTPSHTLCHTPSHTLCHTPFGTPSHTLWHAPSHSGAAEYEVSHQGDTIDT